MTDKSLQQHSTIQEISGHVPSSIISSVEDYRKPQDSSLQIQHETTSQHIHVNSQELTSTFNNNYELSDKKSRTSNDHNVMNEDTRLQPLRIGKLSCIEIFKGSNALGIKVVGGLDMCLKDAIVYEVYDGGVAMKDGRLQVGDHIVEINDRKTCNLTNKEVMMELRRCGPTIKLMILSHNNPSLNAKDQYIQLKDMHFQKKQLTVKMFKKPGKFLGFSAGPLWKNRGLIITSLIKKNGWEGDETELMVGDEIFSVNSIKLENMLTQEALALIKTMTGNLSLEVHRMDVGLSHQATTSSYPLSPLSPTFSNNFNPNFNNDEIKRSKSLIRRAMPTCLLNAGN